MAEEQPPEICSACEGACTSWHRCLLEKKDGKTHVTRLHSYITCDRVVMPVNGFYFCSMECVHEYNSQKTAEFNSPDVIMDVMPDDGPGNSEVGSFLMPARRRPDAEIEPSPEEEAAAAATGVFGEEARLAALQQTALVGTAEAEGGAALLATASDEENFESAAWGATPEGGDGAAAADNHGASAEPASGASRRRRGHA